jgi:WD repeat-containing protein 61
MRLSLLHKADNAHEDSVWTVGWAPGSDILVTGSVDESVKLWKQEGDGLEQLHHLVSTHTVCD